MSVDRYIETLNLADLTFSPEEIQHLWDDIQTKRTTQPANVISQTTGRSLQAAVNVGSVMSFVAGVSAQEKDDVLFSVQLAQRGASGTFDRFNQTHSWYQKYTEILEHLGWMTEQMAFAEFQQSEGEFRMDQAALSIIAAIATQNQLAVLQDSIKALSDLAEKDGTIRLFDFYTRSQTSGNFQIGTVQKAPNDALAMALGAFHFHSSDARRKFLFTSWGSDQVNFWAAAQKMTLNTTLYERHRDAVLHKLGVSSDRLIAELKLA